MNMKSLTNSCSAEPVLCLHVETLVVVSKSTKIIKGSLKNHFRTYIEHHFIFLLVYLEKFFICKKQICEEPDSGSVGHDNWTEPPEGATVQMKISPPHSSSSSLLSS